MNENVMVNQSIDSNEVDTVDSQLWNKIPNNSEYNKNKELYQNHIIDQYKICIEMADRISSRRNLANVFFLTLHTTLIASISIALDKLKLLLTTELTIIFLVLFLLLCIVWWGLLRSYRNINSAKFNVIGQLEKKLPARPIGSREWKELGEGKNIKKYLPLNALEQFVPIIFIGIYISLLFIVS